MSFSKLEFIEFKRIRYLDRDDSWKKNPTTVDYYYNYVTKNQKQDIDYQRERYHRNAWQDEMYQKLDIIKKEYESILDKHQKYGYYEGYTYPIEEHINHDKYKFFFDYRFVDGYKFTYKMMKDKLTEFELRKQAYKEDQEKCNAMISLWETQFAEHMVKLAESVNAKWIIIKPKIIKFLVSYKMKNDVLKNIRTNQFNLKKTEIKQIEQSTKNQWIEEEKQIIEKITPILEQQKQEKRTLIAKYNEEKNKSEKFHRENCHILIDDCYCKYDDRECYNHCNSECDFIEFD
jgi:hypothetical protein